MSTHRSRRIDHATAEQLLAGARSRVSGTQGASDMPELAELSGNLAGHEALAGLLAAAAAPAGKNELSGEQDALAVFRAARLAPAADPSAVPSATRSATRPATPAAAPAAAPGSAAAPAPTPRKRSLRTPATLLGAKVAAAALAAALGGVAVAAGTGNLPTVLGGAPERPAASPTPGARVADAPSPGASGRSSAAVPADLAELCRAFTRAPGPRPEEVLAQQRFAPLVAAAGSRSAVPGYCAPVRGSGPEPTASAPAATAPTASPTRNPRAATPTHPGKPEPSRRPVTPGPSAGEHGPGTRPPGPPSPAPPPPARNVPPGQSPGANP